MDENELNDFARQVCAAALKLQHAETGRQNDHGANLRPAGVLIIPLATDPGVPGAVFSADLVELKKGRQGWHRVTTVRDGEEGDRTNIQPLGGGIGDASAIIGLLSGHLMPGVLGRITGAGDPLRLLSAILGQSNS